MTTSEFDKFSENDQIPLSSSMQNFMLISFIVSEINVLYTFDRFAR